MAGLPDVTTGPPDITAANFSDHFPEGNMPGKEAWAVFLYMVFVEGGVGCRRWGTRTVEGRCGNAVLRRVLPLTD